MFCLCWQCHRIPQLLLMYEEYTQSQLKVSSNIECISFLKDPWGALDKTKLDMAKPSISCGRASIGQFHQAVW